MTIVTITSRASTRCSGSLDRSSNTPPTNTSRVAHTAAAATTASGISGHHPALPALVHPLVAGSDRLRIPGIHEVDDEDVSRLVDVHDDLVRGFAGQDAPQRDVER